MISEHGHWFPRYTTLVGKAGGEEYFSEAFDASGWVEVHAHAMLVAAISMTSATTQFQKSADQKNWTDITPAAALLTGVMKTKTETDPAQPFLRLKITVTGADKVGTFWAIRLVKGESAD